VPPGKYDLTCASFGKPQVHNSNGESIGSVVSAQLTAESLYTLQWATLSSKTAPSHGGSEPPSNTIPWANPSQIKSNSLFCMAAIMLD